ncbi:MAG: hypothetical protein WA873_04340, partial [Jannaschia helgolandensis]
MAYRNMTPVLLTTCATNTRPQNESILTHEYLYCGQNIIALTRIMHMKYMVGETANGTAVFAVTDDEAINLTALDPAVGNDLKALIAAPALARSVAVKMRGASRVPV